MSEKHPNVKNNMIIVVIILQKARLSTSFLFFLGVLAFVIARGLISLIFNRGQIKSYIQHIFCLVLHVLWLWRGAKLMLLRTTFLLKNLASERGSCDVLSECCRWESIDRGVRMLKWCRHMLCSSKIFLLLLLKALSGAKWICYELCNGIHVRHGAFINSFVDSVMSATSSKKIGIRFYGTRRISWHAINLSLSLARWAAAQASTQCVN